MNARAGPSGVATMSDTSEPSIREGWPRRLIPTDMHYAVHKVASVSIRDDILHFQYVDEDGKSITGPFYWGSVNGEKPVAKKELAKSGLTSPDEIRYLVALHTGAFPNGHPMLLLRDYPSQEASDLAAYLELEDRRWREKMRRARAGKEESSAGD
jgi:hypothetical protein